MATTRSINLKSSYLTKIINTAIIIAGPCRDEFFDWIWKLHIEKCCYIFSDGIFNFERYFYLPIDVSVMVILFRK